MKRVAFTMKLKTGYAEEYKRRHDEIWPELVQELSKAGVYDYSIYFDEKTNMLFAVQKLTNSNTADQLPQTDIMRKWWNYMSDIMEVNPDKSPVVKELREVFYMD